jgi:hypothetical protein
MADENRVFDVSRPSRVSPSPTSRPVIVGHHPGNDPMVTGEDSSRSPSTATKIPIINDAGSDGAVTVEQAMAAHQVAEASAQQEEPVQGSPAIFDHAGEESTAMPPAEPEQRPDSVGDGPFTATEPAQSPEPQSELPPPAEPQPLHVEGLHLGEPRPKNRRWIWAVIVLLILVIAAYLAFHFLKHSPAAPTPPTISNKPPASTAPALPAGFKEYKLADTNLTFAAPTAWGDPTSVTDPGYARRGGTNQPTGTYAYLVNFAANKDIQIAVTSSKYLPAARAPLYYDFLQWCTGSSDNKIYQSVLNYSTTNKVDTPTTITCDQGPLADATQINDSTIIQTKATDASSKVIGDIYTMNLKDPVLVVFRAKDAAMTNGPDIKQLLGTVRLTGTSTSNTPTSGQ